MKNYTLKLDESSQLFASLYASSLGTSGGLTLEDVKSHSPQEAQLIEILHKSLDLGSLDGDLTPVYVTVKEGELHRIYGPIVVASEGAISLLSGGNTVPLRYNSRLELEGLPEGVEGELSIKSVEFNGFSNPTLVLSLYKEEVDTLITYHFPFKFKDWQTVKEVDSSTLEVMLKRKPQDLLGLLSEPSKGFAPTLKLHQLLPDEYSVVGYKIINSGQFAVLILEGQPGQQFLDEKRNPQPLPVDVQVYANSRIQRTLELMGDCPSGFGATLRIHSVKPGKKPGSFRASAGFEVDDRFLVKKEEIESDLLNF